MTPSSLTDEQIIAKAASRYRWATSPGLDFDDLLQAARLDLFKSLPSYDPSLPWFSYAYKVALQGARKQALIRSPTVRKPQADRGKRKTIEHSCSLNAFTRDFDNHPVEYQDLLEDTCHATTTLNDKIQAERLMVLAHDILPEKWAECLRLHFMQELSPKEVGQVMGFSRQRADQIISKSLTKLRKAMLK